MRRHSQGALGWCVYGSTPGGEPRLDELYCRLRGLLPWPCWPRRETAVVVSFREEGAKLDEDMVRLARAIHGDGLVPAPLNFHGIMEAADPVLLIYSMPFLRGSSCIDALAFAVDLDPKEEANHGVFVTHLAR